MNLRELFGKGSKQDEERWTTFCDDLCVFLSHVNCAFQEMLSLGFKIVQPLRRFEVFEGLLVTTIRCL